jgi:hypothetical protein
MNDVRTPEGIDFFDFLYEVWQAKWMFLLIVFVSTALAAAPALLNRNTEEYRTVETTISRVGFILKQNNDPLGRTAGMLLGEFLGLVDADSALDLAYAGQMTTDNSDYDRITGSTDRSYAVKLVGLNGVGYFILNLKDGNAELYQSIYDEFARAAEQQFISAKMIAEGTLERIESLEQGSSTILRSAIPDAAVASVQFLATPAVQDGSFRFIDLRPLEIEKTESSIAVAGGRSPTKMILLGAISGFILACIAIMFRIAIQRKKTGETIA